MKLHQPKLMNSGHLIDEVADQANAHIGQALWLRTWDTYFEPLISVSWDEFRVGDIGNIERDLLL